ncbi:MAG: hypothetical protein ACETWG_07385 [Candidatus Neomarinimicrobiota bacterium]
MRTSIIAFLVMAALGIFPPIVKGQSVAVVISEQTVNDFLGAVGPVKGEGTGARKINYNWTVSEPQVDFEPGTAGFKAQVKVKTKIVTLTNRVNGRLAVDYDAATNKIRMQVVEAKFPIYVKVLGTKVKLATLDIGQYYKPKFEFNGPEPVQQEVEMDIGDGNKRRIGVTVEGRAIALEKDQVKVSVALTYAAL